MKIVFYLHFFLLRYVPSLCWSEFPIDIIFLLSEELLLTHLARQVCCCSVAQSCPTLCDPVDCSSQASLSFTISWSLFKLMSIELVMPSHPVIPLLLLPSIFSSIRVFYNVLALHIRWPKYWSFNISPSNEYSGLISFRIDWLDLAVQGTLRNLLQHHILKASIVWHSAFFLLGWRQPYLCWGSDMSGLV